MASGRYITSEMYDILALKPPPMSLPAIMGEHLQAKAVLSFDQSFRNYTEVPIFINHAAMKEPHVCRQPSACLIGSAPVVKDNGPLTSNPNREETASEAVLEGKNQTPTVESCLGGDSNLHWHPYCNAHDENSLFVGDSKVSDIRHRRFYSASNPHSFHISTPSANRRSLKDTVRRTLTDRLQAANRGHLSTHLKSFAVDRQSCPFQRNSPLAAEYNAFAHRRPQITTRIPAAQRVNVEGEQANEQPHTISPRDVLLDYNKLGDYDQLLSSSDPCDHIPDLCGGPSSHSPPKLPSSLTILHAAQAQATEASEQWPFTQLSLQQCNQLPQTSDFPISLSKPRPPRGNFPTTVDTALAIHGGSLSRACLLRDGHNVARKCERVNPSTGEPCNSFFSRPYDLTRHEGTIHSPQRRKVCCQLCTEGRTFSRQDALTRHMRVVHPLSPSC